jgi:hypothetical protein
MVYKERNYWLVLTRTLLAGFDAPIDRKMNGREGAYDEAYTPVHLPASAKRSGCSSAEPYPLD